MKYQAKNKMELIDSDTNQPVELIICACNNEVFYFTSAGDKICACCHMTETEADAQKLAQQESEQAAASAAVMDDLPVDQQGELENGETNQQEQERNDAQTDIE